MGKTLDDNAAMRLPSTILLLLSTLCATVNAKDLGPDNVAILVNGTSPESVEIGEHYRQARGIPEANLCAVATTTEYETTLAAYESEIRAPLADCLLAAGIEQQVLFIVVTWGIPGAITDGGEPVIGLSTRSVDSFLVDPFDAIPGQDNPYFGSDLPFRRENGHVGYLVTRLDGPSPAIARALVDRALAPAEPPGRLAGIAYFDQEPHGDSPLDREVIANAGAIGNGWILQAHQWFGDAGWTVVLDDNDAEFGTAPALLECPDARWYLGWYKAFNYNDVFTWKPRAVGVHIDSFSAMRFREPGSWCAGALASGITATAGAVWEPHLQGFIQGHRFLKAIALDGFTLAEAAWQSIPRLRWMMVVFGDPLFPLPAQEPEPDPEPDPEPGPETTPEAASDTVAPLADLGRVEAGDEPAVPRTDRGCTATHTPASPVPLLLCTAALLFFCLRLRPARSRKMVR